MTKISKEDLQKMMEDTVGKALADHPDLKAFSDNLKLKQIANAEKGDPQAKHIVGKFLAALGSNDKAVLKDLSDSVDANGGYIVPTEFRNQLIEKLYKGAYLRRYATVIPMSSDKMDLPVEGNTVSVNWTTELATITQSDPTFGIVTLAANMLAGISRQSRQLLQDAAINEAVQDLLIRIFARALGLAEDTVFMVGSGTGQPKGIRGYKASFATVAQAGANLLDSDLKNLYYTLPRQYRRGAVWIMRDDRVKLISNLRSTDGRQLHPEVDDIENPTLFGRPIIVQDDIPGNLGGGTNESEMYFGDASYYYIGDREQVFSEVSTQEGQSFEKHRAAVKVGERLDGQLTLNESFAYMTAVK